MRSACIVVLALLVLCCLDCALGISMETLNEWTTKADISDLDYESIFRDRSSAKSFTLEAQTSFGRNITVKVKSSDRIFLDGRPKILGEDFFEGTVAEQENSLVTLTVWKTGLTGRISLIGSDRRRQTIHVDKLDGTSRTVLFNERDVKRQRFGDDFKILRSAVAGGLSGMYGGAPAMPPMQPRPSAGLSKRQNGTAAPRRCRVVVAADSTFVERFGELSVKQMVAIVHDVQQIYLRELEVSLVVQTAFLDSNDNLRFGGKGKSAPGVATEFLNSFSEAVARRQIPAGDEVCLSHLFLHRNLGPSLGEAFTASDDPNVVGGICSGSQGVGISTGLGNGGREIPFSAVVTTVAHEMGHGFGSLHDEATPCTGQNTIMAATVKTDSAPVDNFSSCSLSAIKQTLAAKGKCLS